MALTRSGIDRTPRVFADRAAAGRELARKLGSELARGKRRTPLIVLGLPRGGVAVAAPVASALHAPLDVLVVRKVGYPLQPELAIGAIAAGGIVVRDAPPAHRWLGPAAGDDAAFEQIVAREHRELERREALYRAGREPLDLKDKTVLLVDDGLATGSTMIAAVRAARKAGARAIIAAAPVASPQAIERVSAEADDVVVLVAPQMLFSIGEWYDRFEQLSDAEVSRLLSSASEPSTSKNG
jgi:putative phosphoribosyl transferase